MSWTVPVESLPSLLMEYRLHALGPTARDTMEPSPIEKELQLRDRLPFPTMPIGVIVNRGGGMVLDLPSLPKESAGESVASCLTR